jgi:hypothetical protein
VTGLSTHEGRRDPRCLKLHRDGQGCELPSLPPDESAPCNGNRGGAHVGRPPSFCQVRLPQSMGTSCPMPDRLPYENTGQGAQ